MKDLGETVTPDQQEAYFKDTLGEYTVENLGDGPFTVDGLEMTKAEFYSLHPGRYICENVDDYLIDQLLTIKVDQEKFPKGLCVFDVNFCREYKAKIMSAQEKTSAFQSIIKDYVKRLRAKPKTLVFLLENDGHRFVAVVSKIWLEETEYTEDVPHFKDSPVALILDPVCSMSAQSEELVRR